MIDKNGIEMKTGDIVRISGAYFKNDNGTYFVEHSPEDPTWTGKGHCLKKICRNGKLSTTKYNICFWPLASFVNSAEKRAAAKEHNAEHAEIEIITTIGRDHVKEHFEEMIADYQKMAEWEMWNFGEESERYKETCSRIEFMQKVVNRIK